MDSENLSDREASPLAAGLGLPEAVGTTATLFLDFDGVLHPEYCHPSRFFEALPLFADVLNSRPWVELVVSSNWRYERDEHGGLQLRSWDLAHKWLQSEPLIARRVVGINPLTPDRRQLPDRVLAYEREAQCLAWLRAWLSAPIQN